MMSTMLFLLLAIAAQLQHATHAYIIASPSPLLHPSSRLSSPITTTRSRSSSQLFARPQARSREVHKNIISRRTINEFEPSLPNNWENSLERAITAAIYAPNHKRTEPWRFYLLGPKSIEKVCKLNAEIVASTKGEEAGAKKLKR